MDLSEYEVLQNPIEVITFLVKLYKIGAAMPCPISGQIHIELLILVPFLPMKYLMRSPCFRHKIWVWIKIGYSKN